MEGGGGVARWEGSRCRGRRVLGRHGVLVEEGYVRKERGRWRRGVIMG